MYNSSHPHPQVPERIFDWRAHLPIHQAAELFPLMPEDELRALADDIEKNGLRELVTIWKVDGRWHLLDGRNRLDALVLLGRDILIMGEPIFGTVFQEAKPKPDLLDPPFDPFAFVISKNIVRRHLNLTSEQKRELTIKVLKLDPGRSNREIAKMVHRDGKTVAKDRGKLEATAEIPQLTKTKGKDGKARPARRKTAAPKTAKKAPVTTPPEESAEESRERMKAGFHAAESKTAARHRRDHQQHSPL